jgi:beta-lactamase regulating signal transducer with metallopeptidase domain
MSTSLIDLIAELTLAASVAILIVAAIRKPLRRIGGTRVAYLCWLLVPASQLVVSLPAPSRPLEAASQAIPQFVLSAFPVALSSNDAIVSANVVVTNYGAIGVVVWISGALLMLSLLVRRQKAFIRSLGVMTAMPDGTHRSSTVRGPLLVGAWRPRVVLPSNFESLYESEERTLVLAHERAHRDRRDTQINLVATLWLCLSWFNPLMYWAVARLRLDQELACDAVVLAARTTTRRRYADALLRTQLAADSGWNAPLACSWQSGHPLRERITMLKRSLPTPTRRRSALVLTSTLIVFGSYAAWMTLPHAAYAQSDANRGTLTADYVSLLPSGDLEFSGNVVLESTADGPHRATDKTTDANEDSVARAGPLRYAIVQWTADVRFKVLIDGGKLTRSVDGSFQLEGPIRIVLGNGGSLTTDRATIDKDGTTITMNSARFAPAAQPH